MLVGILLQIEEVLDALIHQQFVAIVSHGVRAVPDAKFGGKRVSVDPLANRLAVGVREVRHQAHRVHGNCVGYRRGDVDPRQFQYRGEQVR